jgi:hypothetical protein
MNQLQTTFPAIDGPWRLISRFRDERVAERNYATDALLKLQTLIFQVETECCGRRMTQLKQQISNFFMN